MYTKSEQLFIMQHIRAAYLSKRISYSTMHQLLKELKEVSTKH